jgi:hypothetical protein
MCNSASAMLNFRQHTCFAVAAALPFLKVSAPRLIVP